MASAVLATESGLGTGTGPPTGWAYLLGGTGAVHPCGSCDQSGPRQRRQVDSRRDRPTPDHRHALLPRGSSRPRAGPYWALAAGRTTISLTSTPAGWLMAYAMASAIAEAGRATER